MLRNAVREAAWMAKTKKEALEARLGHGCN